jgi:ATP-dependent DNA ligase
MIGLMNANPIGKKAEAILADPNYIAEIKWDGCRYEYNESDLISRLGISKGANAPHLIQILSKYNVVLDGEVYYPGKTSNATTSVMGSLPGVATAKQLEFGNIRYVLFDILSQNGTLLIQQPWHVRRKALEKFYESMSEEDKEFIDLSEVFPDKFGLKTLEDVMEYIKKHKIEGLMFKNIKAIYHPDKSPENVWFKAKKDISFEAIISGFTPGKGQYEGLIGSIVFSLYNSNGELVECGKCSGFSNMIRKEISANRIEYLGKIIQVHAMEKTEDGRFRHPTFYSFRDDKDPKRCTMDQV